MSTELENTSTKNTSSDHKATFGPLGKYAIIAVFIVSILITTVIMLNKQLGTAEERLAIIENEVAEMNTIVSDSTTTTEKAATVNNEVAENETAETVATADVEKAAEVAEVTPAETQAVESPSAAKLIEKELTTAATAPVSSNDEQQASPAVSVQIEPVTPVVTAMQAPQPLPAKADFERADWDQERQARLDTYKIEQKQRMTEMFARIKTLESQQLELYKTSQDKQVERLREQIAKQQALIDSLILRNKEWLEMREASMKRSQSDREQILNRI